ncbi:MAG: hydrogenase formation protein HypD [Nitrososphaeria archaeon]
MEDLRDARLIRGIIEKVANYKKRFQFMHACGTHQETLVRYGLDSLYINAGITVKSGPGCPVCVTTADEFVKVMALAENGKTVAVYGDCIKVPVNKKSLMQLKEEGCDIRVVYSIEEALNIAKVVKRDVIFMAIGFETTAPNTAITLMSEDLPENFYVFSCHRRFVPAMVKLLTMGETKLQGLIEPGHVSVIIGTKPYDEIRRKFKIPQVISGFEPLDMTISVYNLVLQNLRGEPIVENEYSRVVSEDGNLRAKKVMEEVFLNRDGDWRGIPDVPASLMGIKEKYSSHDASKQFEDILVDANYQMSPLESSCRCGEVLRGVINPNECPLFNKVCTLENPVGACMVSTEGACRIQAEFSIEY